MSKGLDLSLGRGLGLEGSIRRLWGVLAALTNSYLRSKIGMFFSFLFPAMLLLIFGTIFGGSESVTYALHVQNHDLDPMSGEATNLSSAFIEVLDSAETFEIETLEPDVNITNYVRANPSFDEYRIIVIPDGFGSRAVNQTLVTRLGVIDATLDDYMRFYGDEMNVSEREEVLAGRASLNETLGGQLNTTAAPVLELYTAENDQGSPVIRGILRSIVDGFNQELIGADAVIELDGRALSERSLSATDYYIPGYIAAFVMTNGIISVTANVTEFRRNGIVKRLAATPLGKGTWITANVIWQTILAFGLMALMVFLGFIVFGFNVLPDLYALGFTFVGAVAFCAMGMILGGVIKDVEAATGAGNAIAFPMMFLSGAFIPLSITPPFMQQLAKALPLYYYHVGLRQIMIYQNPSAAVVPFLIMLSIAIGAMAVAIKVTKWKELD